MTHVTLPILEDWEGLSLTTILQEKFHLGKKARHEIRMSQNVLLNNKPLDDWNTPLFVGASLSLPIFLHGKIPVYEYDLEIIYEDDFLLVVNKPVDMKTHPNDSYETDTCANAVQYYLEKTGQDANALAVHRLDQTTSGLVLFAKNKLAIAGLSWQMENRAIHRTYLAAVDGTWGLVMQTINKPIGEDRHHGSRRQISPYGQPAVTHVKVLENDNEKNTSLVECQIETGRTHQIRVHLSGIGHPIIGDTLYGGSPRANRIMLHAEKLHLNHPFKGKEMNFSAPAGDDWVF
ncbi:RluA family pseudouridine synthase [Listeria monocytogenes]|uniref:RluA family pseudouridine synthase n=1 Tax=Listeria monocytogenes TaxID=1639 RepID=UPI0008756E3A|nr:RluA family pseudouridine synthase [Listeria monocytogenes]EAD1400273.1 RluA family pseudouridine synthase [Listeria monocytogenes]EAE6888148.1 RluA family pseudouridine synthase [Listeria monocytogenes]EAF6357199.1 RluA family pseudouridine synthase [Listeria monocytogenes]EAF8208041.1 RluA family pseudouridine synthase [Listeria monocytogenes]EAG0992332.1 RluA family pseudouridine synthase [Listeria monocytogenes]